MLTSEKVYKGMWGIAVIVKTGMDLSDAIETNLLVSKPNGVKVTWSATIQPPATSGILTYELSAGDINVSGKYKVQAELVYADKKLYGYTAFFMVYEKYD